MIDQSEKLARELREDGTLVDIMSACYKDIGLYLRVFFPKRYFRPFGPDHKRVFEAFQNKEIKSLKDRQILIVGQRGIGKTTVIRGLGCYTITFDEARYLLCLGSSQDNAERSSEGIKNMMVSSPMMKKLFGDLRPVNRETDFSKLVWKIRLPGATTGTIVVPKGVESAVRGLNYDEGELSLRPDLILPDDLEKDEQQGSDLQRAKVKENFMAVVKQLVDRGRMDYAPDEIKPWRIFYVGTLLGSDTLVEKLMVRDDWNVITAPICDENYKARWPEFANDEDVRQLREEFKDDMDVFYREFMCLPMDPATATFKPDFFQYYDEIELKTKLGNMVRFVLCDPAKTKKLESADSAVIAVAVDAENERIYVLDIDYGKMHPSELYDSIFTMVEKWGAQAYGVEVTSLYEFITQPLLTEQLRRGLFPEFIELQARGTKEDRIRQLQPLYKKGQIFHNKEKCGPLEQQLVTFPKPSRWDVMDAFAYITQMMEKCSIYLKSQEENIEAQYAALIAEDEASEELETEDLFGEYHMLGGIDG